MATSSKTTTDNGAETGAPFTEKTVAAAHEAIDRLSERVAKTEERLRGAATHGQQSWTEKQEEVRAQVEGSVSSAREYARENPLMTAGIAFAAGLIVANLLRR
ncbi:DUF883 C-terminal domain-containing protein [Marinimicrobium sp. C6131]|uniref:DUF883 C-terminal domain-containing protein n=1 Tax=Marinimicrobium sp. C6131 TaxID=3022676 RepID=UPI00223E2C2E|nr:DUF883 C-terminal domain-containing protein [Marinimicrobium sp. C6131]UZJ45048.1 DUF883 C-terminal domain-containing protein [Marinimicrobium sp. C6131]